MKCTQIPGQNGYLHEVQVEPVTGLSKEQVTIQMQMPFKQSSEGIDLM